MFAKLEMARFSVLAGLTPAGVSHLSLGEGEAAFRERLVACGVGDDPAGEAERQLVARLAAALARYFAGDEERFEAIPLDLSRATAFEAEVYEALRAIPWGETRTYGDLAASIGRPGAARAVGRANARNPVCIIVPCHRVVEAGGGLGGYSGGDGIETKRALLALEGRRAGLPAGGCAR